MHELSWMVARGYSRLYSIVKDRTGRNLKGLARVLRSVRSEREFEACGYRWHFDPRIASAYMRLVGGAHNEPETQAFLRYVLDAIPAPVTFVDVGANIGEFVVPMSKHAKVARVFGFEPHPVCVEVCRRNAELNSGRNVEVRQLVVADGTPGAYVVDDFFAPTSGIRVDAVSETRQPTARLDDQLPRDSEYIVLIDVEGAELAVMKGGHAFIEACRPLIIFEYHEDTRTHFSLAEVQQALGKNYQLYRLRLDGWLDAQLDHTWNCVLVHRDSQFASVCRKRQRGELVAASA